MNTIKKVIILSSKTDSSIMSILTLEKKNTSVIGTLKSYKDNLSGNMLLGIKTGNTIIKQNIKFNKCKCQFLLPSDTNLNGEISSVLVDTNNDKFEPILWGSIKKEVSKTEILSNLRETFARLNPITVGKQTINLKPEENEEPSPIKTDTSPERSPGLSREDFYHTPQFESEVDPIPPTHNEPNYSQISMEEELVNREQKEDIAMAMSNPTALFESTDSDIEREIDKELNSSTTEHKFYNLIADQIEELFAKYPRENSLEKLIDNSKWCKIDSDIEDKYYVVGMIFQNGDIKYICYGVPGNYGIEPPIEMRDYSQWLPIDVTNPYEEGYWVMYQDASTGENIFLN